MDDKQELNFKSSVNMLGINHSMSLIMDKYTIVEILESLHEECLNRVLSDHRTRSENWKLAAGVIKKALDEL